MANDSEDVNLCRSGNFRLPMYCYQLTNRNVQPVVSASNKLSIRLMSARPGQLLTIQGKTPALSVYSTRVADFRFHQASLGNSVQLPYSICALVSAICNPRGERPNSQRNWINMIFGASPLPPCCECGSRYAPGKPSDAGGRVGARPQA